MVETVYRRPRIRDYGTLVDLTASFELEFVGSVAKVLTMAAVSPAVAGGSGGSGGVRSTPGAANEVVGTQDPPGGGGIGRLLTDRGGDGGGAGGPDGGGGGKLPFTGYAVLFTAAVGALLAASSERLQALLRRGQPPG